MKKAFATALAIMSALSVAGCNYQLLDATYEFNYAYISLPNGECVEGKVDSWRDFEDGDQIQVEIGGEVYLTDTTRCVLVKKQLYK